MNFNVKKSISAELNVILWKICALLYLCIRINWIWIKSACDDFHYSLKKILLKWNAEAEFQFKAETRKFSRCSYPKWSKSAIHHNPIKQIHMKTAARLITALVAFRKRHFRILNSLICSRRLKYRSHFIRCAAICSSDRHNSKLSPVISAVLNVFEGSPQSNLIFQNWSCSQFFW